MSKRYISKDDSVRRFSRLSSTAKDLGNTDIRSSGKVTYNVEDHISVLFQMHGSVWGKVVGYCFVNSLLALGIRLLQQNDIYDLTFSDKGHTFMASMVAFLIITRCTICYNRWTLSRKLVSDLMLSSRELLQHTVTFTRNETKPKAMKWRAEVSQRAINILRNVVTVLCSDYQQAEETSRLAELSGKDKECLLISVGASNERSPLVLVTFLRTAIASHVEHLENPLDVNQELALLTNVKDFVTAYHNLMKLSSAPFPFPLVQMARTFLFVWVFTLPFALNNDIVDITAFIFIIFFISYGVLGLECVSIEMDDPFGDDPNDFDVMGFARVVFDDIYIVIQDMDGMKAAKELKESLEEPLEEQMFENTNITESKLLNSLEKQNNVDVDGVDRLVLCLASGKVIEKQESSRKLAIDFTITEVEDY